MRVIPELPDNPFTARLLSFGEFEEVKSLLASLTRRKLISTAASAALLARYTRESGAQSPVSATPTGAWSFTDDMGVTVSLPQTPVRILTALTVGAALLDFGIEPVGVIGMIELPDGSRSPAAGNLDPERTTVIPVSDSGPDLEAVLALEPDLIITSVLQATEDAEPAPAGFVPETLSTVLSIAPILAFNNTVTSVASIITRLEELTATLGAIRPGGYDAAQDAFVSGEQKVRRALQDKPDLSVMAVAGTNENFFVMNPDYWADLSYWQDLGMNLIHPEAGSWYWQTLSWEQANLYTADLLLNDPTWFSIEELSAQPTMLAQPALGAEQVVDRSPMAVWSYQGYAPVLEAMAQTLAATRDDVV